MSAVLTDSLRAAAVNTFEQMVFLLPDSPPDEQQRSRKVTAVASIIFTGPASGILQVRACEGLLPRLAENMLGTDSANQALQLDALGEIANMICGQIFPSIDPIEAFEQLPPQVRLFTEIGDNSRASPAAAVQLGVEGTRADVLLYLFSCKLEVDESE
jgi:hypothetical protein